ncbi:large ribosomal subunit protein mL52 [Anopheles ziemanni]|uniref:large ribosomal subunit protein mL52 n=1 Tax=Anopheles coustani TaxID=139045 RepID=UPI002658D6F2|nr:large ribosomal subunit protein mL52 [Anopheles coustani]XP_058178347.1 large ribosomal subunit protein mL52 [Anopheles ziemanni]
MLAAKFFTPARWFHKGLQSARGAIVLNVETKKCARNPNKSSPLTHLPDYTFMDGRVTPFGSNQKKRILQQREIAKQIVTLSKEMDFAVERHDRINAEQAKRKEDLVREKLKPKGHLLLKKSK